MDTGSDGLTLYRPKASQSYLDPLWSTAKCSI